MAKVITFSRAFPAYHPRKGEPTFFREKFLHSLLIQGKIDLKSPYVNGIELNLKAFSEGIKNHTIREGNRFKAGEYFSPRIRGNDINPKSKRSGPYQSKQIIIGPDTLIEKVWDFEIRNDRGTGCMGFFINDLPISPDQLEDVAKNDGLERHDLQQWFKYPKPFKGQIICWNKEIHY